MDLVRYEGKLRRICEDHGTDFIDYDSEMQQWTFKVTIPLSRPAYLLSCQPTSLPVYLLTCLLTYLPSYLPTPLTRPLSLYDPSPYILHILYIPRFITSLGTDWMTPMMRRIW